MPDELFSKPSLSFMLRGSARAMHEDISRLPRQVFEQESHATIRERFLRRYVIAAPLLRVDESVQLPPEDIRIRQDQNPRQLPRVVQGTRFRVKVPFLGGHGLLLYRPSQFRTVFPTAEQVGDGTITISFDMFHRGPEANDRLKRDVQAALDLLAFYFNQAAADIESYNSKLGIAVDQALRARVCKLQSDAEATMAIGLPVASDLRIFAQLPEIQPQTPLSPVSEAVARGKITYVLSESDYDRILAIIAAFTEMIERSPDSFVSLGEEQIRDLLVAHLNGHFPGCVTRESKNAAGKTDIFIHWRDRDVFIAECKMWHGASEYLQAIDQLLRYCTWHDTSTAVLVFNRRKHVSSVLQTIAATTVTHPQYIQHVRTVSPGHFRYEFRQNDDDGGTVRVAILVFDIPGVS